MGRSRYPAATELLVTPDGGGSKGARGRLWKVALQRLADQTGLRIPVYHFPPEYAHAKYHGVLQGGSVLKTHQRRECHDGMRHYRYAIGDTR